MTARQDPAALAAVTDGAELERVALLSALVNVALLAIHALIAASSSSLAVAAEATHNAADLSASFAVLAGLRLSRRRSAGFPWGLYKIENIVAVLIGISIFIAAWEILVRVLDPTRTAPDVSPWMIPCVVLAGALPVLFSRYELRVARAHNSPSLAADAREFQAHALSSGALLIALVGANLGLTLDRIAAAGIVVLIARLAWQTLLDGIRVLLDASVDRETLEEVERVLRSVPGVVDVSGVIGRNAGPCRFVEAQLSVRTGQLEHAHRIAEEAARRVREQVPHIERVLVNAVPRTASSIRVAVPLRDADGATSEHFGLAPWFGFADLDRDSGRVMRRVIETNPFASGPRGRGMQVARWLIENRTDVLVSRDDVRDKGPGHMLAAAGIDVRTSEASRLDDALPVARA